MTDRELLEAAAKAAGIKNAMFYEQSPERGIESAYAKIGKVKYWSPLTDDGDALRLAVKLGLYIGGKFTAHQEVREFVELGEQAAVRRAIVRAAAALAKSPIPTGAPKP